MHPNSLKNLESRREFKQADENINRNGRPPKTEFLLLAQLPKGQGDNISKESLKKLQKAILAADIKTLKKILDAEKNNLSLIEQLMVSLTTKKGKTAREVMDMLKLAGLNYDKDEVSSEDTDAHYAALGKLMLYIETNANRKIKRDVLHNDSEYLIMYGGRDSGKTHGVCQKIALLLMLSTPFRGLMVRKVRAIIKGSQFQMIKDIIAAADLVDCFDYNLQDLSITCKFTQNTIKAVGLQDASKSKSLANYHFAWYEEPNTDGVTYTDFMTLDTTLRSANESGLMQSIFTFNSDAPDTWFKSEFFPEGLLFENELPHRYMIRANEMKEYKTSIIHFTYKDNRYISEKRIEKLESLKETDPMYYRIWTLGLWGGDPQGKVYQKWEIIEDSYFPETNIAYTTIGIDWGFNDPMTLIECSVIDKVVYLRELYYESGKQIEDLIEFINTLDGEKKGCIYYADPSRYKENESALRNKANIAIMKANNAILNGIGMLKRLPIKVNANSVNLIRELKRYEWRFDVKLNKYIDIPVDFDNHALDAARYAAADNSALKEYCKF